MTNSEITNAYLGTDQVDALYLGTELVWENNPSPVPYDEQYLTVEALEDGNFTIRKSVDYSKNGGSWTPAYDDQVLSLVAGDKVRFKYNTDFTTPYRGVFEGNTIKFKVYGNIESMEYGDDFIYHSSIVFDFAFISMFEGCTGLVDASNLVLPATRLTVGCYNRMFYGCTNLEKAPELRAREVPDCAYAEMFYDCESLTYLKCYALTIGDGTDFGGPYSAGTYNWVHGVGPCGEFVEDYNDRTPCPWTIGDSGIPAGWERDMRYYEERPLTFTATRPGRIKLVKQGSSAPTLSLEYRIETDPGSWGEWLDSSNPGYVNPYNGIRIEEGQSIQFRGNQVPAINQGTYNFFSGDTSGFKVSGNIMSLVDSTGYTSASAITSAYAFALLFKNFSNLADASNLVLPATTLAANCYYGMFSGCTSLEYAPNILPATTLATNCYYGMFRGCTGLQIAPILAEAVRAAGENSCYVQMFFGCSRIRFIKCLSNGNYGWSSGWLTSAATTVTGSQIFVTKYPATWQRGNNGIPSGWTIYTCEYPKGAWLMNHNTTIDEAYSGSTSGDTYVWDFGNGEHMDYFYVIVDGVFQTVNAQVCGYATKCGGTSGSEGGWDEGNGEWIECSIQTGATRVQAAYDFVSASYNPYSNAFFMETEREEACTCEDQGLCDDGEGNCVECPDECDNWESLGYESYEDCTCANYGENCGGDEPGVDCASDWESLGYQDENDCRCQEYGEDCPE